MRLPQCIAPDLIILRGVLQTTRRREHATVTGARSGTRSGGTAFAGGRVALTGDLGDLSRPASGPLSKSLERGGVHYFAFTVTEAQVRSAAGGGVFVRAVVERHASLMVAAAPRVAGLAAWAFSADGDRTAALFEVTEAGTYLLEVRGATQAKRVTTE